MQEIKLNQCVKVDVCQLRNCIGGHMWGFCVYTATPENDALELAIVNTSGKTEIMLINEQLNFRSLKDTQTVNSRSACDSASLLTCIAWSTKLALC